MNIESLDETIEYLEANGLQVIRPDQFNCGESKIILNKDIDSFIKAAKALKETTVFINPYVFEKWDLYLKLKPNSCIYSNYSNFEDENYIDDEDENYIDGFIYLPSIVHELKEYKKYFGEIANFSIYVFFKNQTLKYYQSDDWLADYVDLLERAEDVVDNMEYELALRIAEKKAADEEKANKREDQLIKKLRSLLKNKTFIMLNTQRAMKSYALKVYPKLEELPPNVLRDEIASLSDEIETNALIKMTKKV